MFPIPYPNVNPPFTQTRGVAGVRINLVQNNPDWNADNWDITSLDVTLFDSVQLVEVCQLKLTGNSRLEDGHYGLVRLSKSPGHSGSGPHSPVYSPGPNSGCP